MEGKDERDKRKVGKMTFLSSNRSSSSINDISGVIK